MSPALTPGFDPRPPEPRRIDLPAADACLPEPQAGGRCRGARMAPVPGGLGIRLATDPRDLRAAYRLRYRVFVTELGGDGPMVDHAAGLECDAFDAACDHLVLIDRAREAAGDDHVVGVYRLLPQAGAEAFGRFYCDGEYDLAPLRRSGRRLLELGRACVHPDYRRGQAMFLLWSALADYVLAHGIEVLFGVASFPGTDPAPLAQPLAWLHCHHLAPPELRVAVREAGRQRMDLLPHDALDRAAAMAAMPALIRAYLRLGGLIGEGAWIDRGFNTIDVCMMMDTGAMSARHRSFYARRSGARG